LREVDDFTHIAELTARDMAAQNIRYAEMFFSPSLFVRQGLEVQELTRAIRVGLAAVPAIEIALIADLVRDHGPEAEATTVAKLNEVKSEGVVGIGIGGSEHEYPPKPFAALYEEARRLGFRTTAHAGEAAGPESVRGAIDHLRVDRIGHGTRAREDSELLDCLAERGIPLELCPVSNARTGVVASVGEHPVRDFLERGLIVSVNTDDPKMFGTSLEHEYSLLQRECGLPREDVLRLILLGIESSWLSEERKKSLAASFRRDAAWSERE
jgi:adenosine deaminase